MKNQRKAWLAAGLLALGAAACFSDPTSDLRSGPAALTVNFLTVSVAAGDSVTLIGTVVDAQGNPLPVGAVTWSSADANVAVVNVDTIAKAPGDIFTRAYVRGIAAGAGVTTVTVTAQGVTNTVRVTVLPKTFPGTVAVTGTPGADTILVSRPAPLPVLVVTFSAGDTLVLTASPTVTFSATASTVTFGAIAGKIISRTATVIKALAVAPYAGKVTVTNLTYAGDATTGPISIASLQTDSVAVQHGRYHGTATVGADPNFGANSLITVTAPAGMTFDATTSLALGGTPPIGTTAAVPAAPLIVLSQSATVLTAISPAALTGVFVVVRNPLLGTVRIDSLRAGTAGTPAVTIVKSAFPGTVTGAGKLLDVITISGGAVATFTTAAATASTVTIGAVNGVPQQAFILSRSATTITAIAKVGNNAAIVISNVIIAGTTIPSLATSAPFVVSTATTGETNEPGNNTTATGTVVAFTGAADTITVYGSIDCEDDGTACPGNGDITDRYLLTTTAAANLRMIVDWYGNGTGGQGGAGYGNEPQNPDIDILIRTAANVIVAQDAGLTQPATASTAALQPIGTYQFRVDGWVMAGPITYRMRILRF